MMRKLNCLAFLLIMAGGCLYLLWQLGTDEQKPPQKHLSWLDGSVTHALDQRISAITSSHQRLDNTINGLLYASTGDPDPQVRQGCPDWLFLTEEVVESPKAQAHLAARLALLQHILADLKKRHIDIIAVPVPDKVMQAKDQLCGLAVSRQAQSRYDTWKSVSSGIDLQQVDLRQNWIAPGYWQTDTHWNRLGADFAARQIAIAARPYVPSDALSMDLQVSETARPRVGDLMTLARIDRNTPPFAPPVEQEKTTRLMIEHAGGLLDDVAAPAVILAGSSYSVNAGFIDYLQWHLKQEVVQKSFQGSGFAGSLIDVISAPDAQLKDTRLILWEWPLRVLFQPLTDKENQYLQQQGVTP